MARLFPFRPDSPEVAQEPRLVNLDDTGADDVFAALSSETARNILSRLYEEPGTATDVADAADTSLQNARYHLDKLRDAGLVEEVDTWYSSRGTEMTVYAPTNEPLVVAAGREESTGVLREALKRVLGAVGVLGVASVLVDRFAQSSFLSTGDDMAPSGGADGGGPAGNGDGDVAFYAAGNGTPGSSADADGDDLERAATETPQADMAAGNGDEGGTPTDDAVTPTVDATPDTATETVTDVVTTDGGVVEAAAALPPGLLFFAGGLLMVALAVGWWYAFRYRAAVA